MIAKLEKDEARNGFARECRGELSNAECGLNRQGAAARLPRARGELVLLPGGFPHR